MPLECEWHCLDPHLLPLALPCLLQPSSQQCDSDVVLVPPGVVARSTLLQLQDPVVELGEFILIFLTLEQNR